MRIHSQEGAKQILDLESQIAQIEQAKSDAESTLRCFQKSSGDELTKVTENFNSKISSLESEIEELTTQQEVNLTEWQQKAEK